MVALLVVLYIVFGAPAYLAGQDAPYLLRAVSYPLFHANVFHLTVNCIAVWSVFSPKRRHLGRDLTLGMLISALVYCTSARPLIGISDLLFAVLGMRTPALSSPWWRKPEVLVFLAVMFMMVLIPNLAGVPHIAAFVLGMAVAALARKFRSIDEEVRRAIGR